MANYRGKLYSVFLEKRSRFTGKASGKNQSDLGLVAYTMLLFERIFARSEQRMTLILRINANKIVVKFSWNAPLIIVLYKPRARGTAKYV